MDEAEGPELTAECLLPRFLLVSFAGIHVSTVMDTLW